MKSTLLALTVVAVVAAAGVTAYNQGNRYSAVSGSAGVVYKLDRRTGVMTMIVGGQEIPVEPSTTSVSPDPGSGDLPLADDPPMGREPSSPDSASDAWIDEVLDELERQDQRALLHALYLAKSALTLELPGAYASTNDDEIRSYLKTCKGTLSVEGWRAVRISDETFAVAYLYTLDGNQKGWFFEVNKNAEIVRSVDEDPELKDRYRRLF